MCGLEFPDIESGVWAEHRGAGLRVVGVASNLLGGETPDTLRQFARQTKISFPIAWDSDSYKLFRAAGGGGIAPFPLDVVIGRDGRVAYVSRKYDERALRAVIEAELSKR